MKVWSVASVECCVSLMMLFGCLMMLFGWLMRLFVWLMLLVVDGKGGLWET
jgi:hypothetical protein